MKIVHLADTHLGWRTLHHLDPDTGRNQREQDVYAAFTAAIDQIVALSPAAVVHAGDCFDGYHPTATALAVFLDGIEKLREHDIPLVVIAGNHSTPRVNAAAHIFDVIDRFPGVNAVYGEPRWVPAADDLAVYAIPHSHEAAVLDGWIREARPSSARHNVLVAHCGLGLGQVVGSEAGSVDISGEAFNDAGDFDYVALGHLHQFKAVRDNAAYAGSMERLSWADTTPFKGVVEVDLAADRMSGDYLTRHPVAGRPHHVLDTIDVAGVEDISREIIVAAGRIPAGGIKPVVKLTVRNVSPAAWTARNVQGIAAAFAGCLHAHIEPVFTATGATRQGVEATGDLRAYLADHVPAGMEPTEFFSRAEAYVGRAQQELIS
jgi:DNA repair exonuclease SbcCD nuclease subunit